MHAAFRRNFSVIAAAVIGIAFVSRADSAVKEVDVPLEDMRKDSADQVREKALRYARDGIVVVYSGENATLDDVVKEVAGECAERGFQVKAVLITAVDARSGVVLYGQDGGPLGPMIYTSGNLRAETGAQIDQLKHRLDRLPSQTAAVDPMDVVHCRREAVVGSLVRKVKICSTPREDAELAEKSKKWTTDQQNSGGNEAKPGG